MLQILLAAGLHRRSSKVKSIGVTLGMVHDRMVYIECAETATVSRGTSHVDAVSTPHRWVLKNAPRKAIHSCRIT